MAIVSMAFSVNTVAFPNLRRPKRYPGMAFASLNSKESTALGVRVTEGEGNLPKVVLTSSVGSEAEIYLFGGCITSWKVANGKDLLFVRPDAVFNKKKPISGGIPHCFPQFGPGAIQQHGFARNMDWSLVDSESVDGNPAVTLELKDESYSRAMWDFSFHALFKGLKGCKTLNKNPDPSNPVEGVEVRDVINFPGFVDCVYLASPNELHLDNGLGDLISIKNTTWSDAVLWNPHIQMQACYRDFVCVENAKIGNVELEPDQTWTAVQHIGIA